MSKLIGAIIKDKTEPDDYLYLVVGDRQDEFLECFRIENRDRKSPDWMLLKTPSLFVNVLTKVLITSSSVEIQFNIENSKVEEILREHVRSSVRSYYRTIHEPIHEAPYQPGGRIPYGGRVYGEEEMLALADANMDFWLTAGRFSSKFEQEFSKKIGVRFCALVNSGSSANLLALTALTSPLLGDRRLLPGDEVITVAAGFPTTIAPIIQNKCVPVFVDVVVEDGTYNIDLEQVEAAVSTRTKAIMVAHTLGNPVGLDRLLGICHKHNLWFVEDNCDALGSIYKGQFTGTFGDLATSSFYPPHHITMGEGGAVYSKSIKLKRPVESFRDWGRDCWCASGMDNTCGKRFKQKLGTLPEGYDHKYTYSHFGYNLKATDLQAAIGTVQLSRLEQFSETRRNNWQKLREGFSDLEDRFILPNPTPGSIPSWFGFLLSVREGSGLSRNDLVRKIEERNIQTRMLFAGNILRHPIFDSAESAGIKYRVIGNLKNSDFILNNTFWLGVYPGLKDGMVDEMIHCVRGLVS